MTHQDPDHIKVSEEEANAIVSPANTGKLYGVTAIQDDPPATATGNIETESVEDTDGVAEENTFPSAD